MGNCLKHVIKRVKCSIIELRLVVAPLITGVIIGLNAV